MAYQFPTNKRPADPLLTMIKDCLKRKIQREGNITSYVYSIDDLVNDVYLQLYDKQYNLHMVQRTIVNKLISGYKLPFAVDRYGLFPKRFLELHGAQETENSIGELDPKPDIFAIIREEFIRAGIDGSIESIRENRPDISLEMK